MGLLDNIKKTIADNLPDVVTNPQISGQSRDMLYKFDKIALLKGSRLIVGPSQEAIFVQNGIIDGIFEPGSYELETDNIPIAKQLLTLAYGGDSPNRAEIWFVNKAVVMDVVWGTPVPLSMEERKFDVPLTIKVRCNGSLSLKIIDSRTLFTEMAGQGKIFSVENFKDAMRGMMVSRLQKTLGEYMMTNNVGFVALQQGISVIENPLKELMQKELDPYGLSIEGCYVKGFTVVEDDSWERYKKYEDEYFKIQADVTRIERIGLAEATRLESLGITYDKERQFDVMDKAASNNSMSPLGSPVSLGVGIAAGRTLGNKMNILANESFSEEKVVAPKAEKEVLMCPNCNAEYSGNVKFCPECAYSIKKICAACETVIKENIKFCSECGKKLVICKSCGTDNNVDAIACSKCTKPIVEAKSCSSCGFSPKEPTKFCSECGTIM